MPWTRSGDNAATYPSLMKVAGYRGADERTVNEVAGWLFRCAFQSAAHLTDYEIDAGTAQMLGGARTAELVRMCVRAGLLTAVQRDGERVLKLVEDPEFIHIRLRKEVEWERQQRNDTRDPGLRVPMLLRDGDNCRWCGVLVMWRGRTSKRTGTMEHLVPGEAGTPDTVVVSCKGCNSSRQDNPQWEDDHPLRPPPAAPNYGDWTAAFLTENGYPTTPNLTSSQARASDVPSAAPAGLRGASTPSSQARSVAGAAAAVGAREVAEKSPEKSPGRSDGTTPAGSGRDGSGSPSYPPRDVDAPPGSRPARPGRTRRSRRGGRRNKPKGEICPLHQTPDPCQTCTAQFDTQGDQA